MIYPSLVRKKDCKTDIHVILYGENISVKNCTFNKICLIIDYVSSNMI